MLLAWFAVAVGGCTTEPLPDVCPNVEVGELVISELRGDQADPADSFGEYVELYNASGKTVDLLGTRLHVRSIGGDERELLVRESLELAAGGYAVFLLGPTDFLFAGGYVEFEACGELIDQTFYDEGTLPNAGTLACGNASNPPDADANDERDSPCWCVDAEPDPTLFGIGLPGSPGSANRCP